MALEYFKDGKKVECKSIGTSGFVGQIVIYGRNVDWSSPDKTVEEVAELQPLSRYEAPAVFKIIQKILGKDGYYILEDSNKKPIRVQCEHYGAYSTYLFDAQDWVTWDTSHKLEKLSRKQRKVEQLEGHLALLKDILVNQGFRVITEEQANELGFKGGAVGVTKD
jgi:hypothetical protein